MSTLGSGATFYWEDHGLHGTFLIPLSLAEAGYLWNGRTVAQVNPLVSCLLYLWALPVLPAPKIPSPNQVQGSSTCAHRVWPRRPCDQLRVMLFLSFSKRPYLLLPVPKYCLRVLTTFSPLYSFWMKWKLILSELVRSCVIFPHPIIKALQGGVRRDSQATTPPSRCRRG